MNEKKRNKNTNAINTVVKTPVLSYKATGKSFTTATYDIIPEEAKAIITRLAGVLANNNWQCRSTKDGQLDKIMTNAFIGARGENVDYYVPRAPYKDVKPGLNVFVPLAEEVEEIEKAITSKEGWKEQFSNRSESTKERILSAVHAVIGGHTPTGGKGTVDVLFTWGLPQNAILTTANAMAFVAKELEIAIIDIKSYFEKHDGNIDKVINAIVNTLITYKGFTFSTLRSKKVKQNNNAIVSPKDQPAAKGDRKESNNSPAAKAPQEGEKAANAPPGGGK